MILAGNLLFHSKNTVFVSAFLQFMDFNKNMKFFHSFCTFRPFSSQQYTDEKPAGTRSLQVPGVIPGEVPEQRPHTSGEAPTIALHVQNSLRK